MSSKITADSVLDGDLTSENDQNAADVSATQPEYVPAVKLYAGIFTKLDGEEYAVIEKNKDIMNPIHMLNRFFNTMP